MNGPQMGINNGISTTTSTNISVYKIMRCPIVSNTSVAEPINEIVLCNTLVLLLRGVRVTVLVLMILVMVVKSFMIGQPCVVGVMMSLLRMIMMEK